MELEVGGKGLRRVLRSQGASSVCRGECCDSILVAIGVNIVGIETYEEGYRLYVIFGLHNSVTNDAEVFRQVTD